ncbi:MAG: hypothetical protein FJ317_00065 [SAR202 cluster bacterium]|nr:hypothetical protein [SAR202 cluster bacterium]
MPSPTATPTVTPTPSPTPTPAPVGQRSLRDRPDEVEGYQLHLLYVIPSDGGDLSLDTTGALNRSVAAMQNWLISQTSGPKLRFDTYQGELDISFFKLSRTDADVRSFGLDSQSQLQIELLAAGFDHSDKIYVVYYGGNMDGNFCGVGTYPPYSFSVMYLQGGQLNRTSGIPCFSTTLTGSESAPDYWEYVLVHEVFHALGFVPDCAPNVSNGHVVDAEADIMAAQFAPLTALILDSGRDDYYGHSIAGCPDLSKSVFFEPPPSDAVLPVDWPAQIFDRLQPESCEMETELRSENQGPEVDIQFVNATGRAVQLHWLNFNGDRQLFGTLQPWSRGTQGSFGGYPWVLADLQGNCLSVFISPATPGRAFVRN